jgi:GNAT superfamily N-acetyltransferase
MSGLTVRPYVPADRQAVRQMAVATAHRGTPSRGILGDQALLADLLTDYYCEQEPDALSVLENSGNIVGYLTGCLNTTAYLRGMARRTVPRALWRAAQRGVFFRRDIWSLLGRALRNRGVRHYRTPAVLARWPAHLHLNLLPEARGKGGGRALVEWFLDHLRHHRVPGVHLATRSDSDAPAFFRSMGFRSETQHALLGLLPEDPALHSITLFVRDLS